MRRLSTAQRFGPLQVLFIMGVQTLVVPSKSFPCPLALFFGKLTVRKAILLGLQYATDIPEISTWCLTAVALSLPLSSLWAGSTISNRTPAGSSLGPKPPVSGSGGSASRLKSFVASEKSAGDTLRSNSIAPLSPRSLAGELADVEHGLPLGKSWSRS
jgi:hypothetical protein